MTGCWIHPHVSASHSAAAPNCTPRHGGVMQGYAIHSQQPPPPPLPVLQQPPPPPCQCPGTQSGCSR